MPCQPNSAEHQRGFFLCLPVVVPVAAGVSVGAAVVVELSGAWVVVVDPGVSVGVVVVDADESVAWPPLMGVPAPVASDVDGAEPVVVWAITAPGSATAASRAMNVLVIILNPLLLRHYVADPF